VATFLVAHGAWSAGWAWKKMHPLMAAAGHRLLTPIYTGLGERAHLASPAIDLDTHVADILAVITYEELRQVILIGHSYGGMVATAVADRARDRIAKLVYLDASHDFAGIDGILAANPAWPPSFSPPPGTATATLNAARDRLKHYRFGYWSDAL